MAREAKNEAPTLGPWDPKKYVGFLTGREVLLSRGFLRAHPERWFPGLSAHWLPLAFSLSAELKVLEVIPVPFAPYEEHVVEEGAFLFFKGSIDEEPFLVAFEREAEQVFVNSIAPEAGATARGVISEYLVRRFIASLALSWSGPQTSTVRFIGREDRVEVSQIDLIGSIKLTLLVNGRVTHLWISLGPEAVHVLDGLWRRQLHSSTRGFGQGGGLASFKSAGDLRLEVAQLAVPPALLVDYLKAGTVIDLEVPVSDALTLKLGGRPWLLGRLREVDGNLGFEIVSTSVAPPVIPEGTTRICIEFEPLRCDPTELAELAQQGASYATSYPLSDKVHIVINGEEVGQGVLRTYEGRFALSIL